MHQTIGNICEMKKKLTECTKAWFDKGMECVDTDEAGKIVDMIKDLAEAEKDSYKACYYKLQCEALTDDEMMAEIVNSMPWYMEIFSDSTRAGYDNYRYPSNGRFASKGKGTYYGHGSSMRRGYVPGDYYPEYNTEMHHMENMLPEEAKHGKAYREFENARRHYTQTHSQEDRKMMNEHAKAHVFDTVETMKDIWSEADPELRKQMKEELTRMVAGLSV